MTLKQQHAEISLRGIRTHILWFVKRDPKALG